LLKIDAMQVEPTEGERYNLHARSAGVAPIIQFPEDEEELGASKPVQQPKFVVDQAVYEGVKSTSRSGSVGPSSSDMIPPMRGLSHLQVSFGLASDVHMIPGDSVLGKRPAEDDEVQGHPLNLSLGLNYSGRVAEKKKDDGDLGTNHGPQARPGPGSSSQLKPTGHSTSGKKARPYVWSRQAQ
jgi:hypothetical protein